MPWASPSVSESVVTSMAFVPVVLSMYVPLVGVALEPAIDNFTVPVAVGVVVPPET